VTLEVTHCACEFNKSPAAVQREALEGDGCSALVTGFLTERTPCRTRCRHGVRTVWGSKRRLNRSLPTVLITGERESTVALTQLCALAVGTQA
jgi:hypothetical protein